MLQWKNVIIGWAMMGSRKLSQWTLRTIYNQNKQEEMKRVIFLLIILYFLCDHGGLHTMKSRKGKYTPGNVYNQMKELFIKYWKENRSLGLYSSGDIPS